MDGLTLTEVADRLGVHYMTVYKYVRLGKLPAVKNGAVWVVDESDLAAFRAQPEASVGTDWAGDLELLLLRGDTTAGWTLVEQALASSVTPERVITDLMGPALRSIGDRWEAGEIDVYDEHLASATLRRLLSRLSPALNRRGNKRGRILVAMAAGELHDLGAEMVAEILRGAHYDVLTLGADTPDESLARAVDRMGDITAVVIGATMDAGSVASAIRTIRARGSEVPVLVGGMAFATTGFEEVGADGFISGSANAVRELESVLATGSS